LNGSFRLPKDRDCRELCSEAKGKVEAEDLNPAEFEEIGRERRGSLILRGIHERQKGDFLGLCFPEGWLWISFAR